MSIMAQSSSKQADSATAAAKFAVIAEFLALVVGMAIIILGLLYSLSFPLDDIICNIPALLGIMALLAFCLFIASFFIRGLSAILSDSAPSIRRLRGSLPQARDRDVRNFTKIQRCQPHVLTSDGIALLDNACCHEKHFPYQQRKLSAKRTADRQRQNHDVLRQILGRIEKLEGRGEKDRQAQKALWEWKLRAREAEVCLGGKEEIIKHLTTRNGSLERANHCHTQILCGKKQTPTSYGSHCGGSSTSQPDQNAQLMSDHATTIGSMEARHSEGKAVSERGLADVKFNMRLEYEKNLESARVALQQECDDKLEAAKLSFQRFCGEMFEETKQHFQGQENVTPVDPEQVEGLQQEVVGLRRKTANLEIRNSAQERQITTLEEKTHALVTDNNILRNAHKVEVTEMQAIISGKDKGK